MKAIVSIDLKKNDAFFLELLTALPLSREFSGFQISNSPTAPFTFTLQLRNVYSDF